MDFGSRKRLQCGGFFGEEAGGEGAISVRVKVSAGGVEARVVTEMGRRVREETAVRVVAVKRREGRGVAGEEGGGGRVLRAVAAGGAFDPNEVAASISDEEEALGRGAKTEVDEVLAGAGGGAGDERGFESGVRARGEGEGGEEEGEAVGVGGEGLGRGGEGVFMEEGELQIVGGGGIGIGELCEREEKKNEMEEGGNGERCWLHFGFGDNTEMRKTKKTRMRREQM